MPDGERFPVINSKQIHAKSIRNIGHRLVGRFDNWLVLPSFRLSALFIEKPNGLFGASVGNLRSRAWLTWESGEFSFEI